eukprot:scaffold1896_cov121-Isochrysis_galbana.AAC.6
MEKALSSMLPGFLEAKSERHLRLGADRDGRDGREAERLLGDDVVAIGHEVARIELALPAIFLLLLLLWLGPTQVPHVLGQPDETAVGLVVGAHDAAILLVLEHDGALLQHEGRLHQPPPDDLNVEHAPGRLEDTHGQQRKVPEPLRLTHAHHFLERGGCRVVPYQIRRRLRISPCQIRRRRRLSPCQIRRRLRLSPCQISRLDAQTAQLAAGDEPTRAPLYGASAGTLGCVPLALAASLEPCLQPSRRPVLPQAVDVRTAERATPPRARGPRHKPVDHFALLVPQPDLPSKEHLLGQPLGAGVGAPQQLVEGDGAAALDEELGVAQPILIRVHVEGLADGGGEGARPLARHESVRSEAIGVACDDIVVRDAGREHGADHLDALEHAACAQLLEHEPLIGRAGRERRVGLDGAHKARVGRRELCEQFGKRDTKLGRDRTVRLARALPRARRFGCEVAWREERLYERRARADERTRQLLEDRVAVLLDELARRVGDGRHKVGQREVDLWVEAGARFLVERGEGGGAHGVALVEQVAQRCVRATLAQPALLVEQREHATGRVLDGSHNRPIVGHLDWHPLDLLSLVVRLLVPED